MKGKEYSINDSGILGYCLIDYGAEGDSGTLPAIAEGILAAKKYYMRNIDAVFGDGNTVVQYEYDSWGKVLSITGSLAGIIGTCPINKCRIPLRSNPVLPSQQYPAG